MNYPLISEYIESIKLAEDNFDELSYLRPVLDADGQPVMSSGNFAVVFKMKDERDGKLYAVRCFHRDQEGRAESYRLIEEELKDVASPYLVSFRYIDKELFVDSGQIDETEFPVLLMDWVEGITLDKYLRENLDDQYALEMLAYRFSLLAQWLIPQPFAHGDLKPDNILVREDGTLVLVDYDGMYVPAMKGQKARELGSPDFRHPLRTEDDFDEHIDDFPLVSILLSLKAISINPSLLEEYGATDRLLLSEKDYRDVCKCQLLMELFPTDDMVLNQLVGVLMISIIEKDISMLPLKFIRVDKPKELIVPSFLFTFSDSEIYSTEIKSGDLEKAWEDEYEMKIVTEISGNEWNNSLRSTEGHNSATSDKWALYSKNQKKLLRFSDENCGQCGEDIWEEWCSDYVIKKGTLVLCDNAFKDCKNLCFLQIPSSVKYIGKKAFSNCWSLHSIELPDLEWISEDAFDECLCLSTIAIPRGTYTKFAKLLPYNNQQLKEIDKDVCRKNIIVYLCDQEEVETDNLNYYHRMITLLQSMHAFHKHSETTYSFHCYGNRECCVFVKEVCSYRITSPQFQINDIENIEELTNAIYYLLLDAGMIDIFC